MLTYLVILLPLISFFSPLHSFKAKNTRAFCRFIGKECKENKFAYSEKCPSSYSYKCGINKCAKDEAIKQLTANCKNNLKAESILNSNVYMRNFKIADDDYQ